MHWLCEIQLFENGILHNHCSDNDEPNLKDNSEIALHCSLLRGSTDFFSASPRGNIQLSKLSIRTKLVVKMVFCTIIVVTMLNPIRRITLDLPCTVPCYAVQQIFFSASPRGNVQLSKLSIGTKLVVKMVFCTIINIVVIMSNPFRRIFLNLSCTVLC